MPDYYKPLPPKIEAYQFRNDSSASRQKIVNLVPQELLVETARSSTIKDDSTVGSKEIKEIDREGKDSLLVDDAVISESMELNLIMGIMPDGQPHEMRINDGDYVVALPAPTEAGFIYYVLDQETFEGAYESW